MPAPPGALQSASLSAARNQNSIIAVADSLTVPQRCPDLELSSSNSLDATELFLPLRFDSSGEVSALGPPAATSWVPLGIMCVLVRPAKRSLPPPQHIAGELAILQLSRLGCLVQVRHAVL